MIDFAISFYNDYLVLFYLIVIIAVILEWPIVILTLTLLSAKLEIPFFVLIILALIWDFWWDLLHFFAWKIFHKKFEKSKKLKKFENFKEKINNFPLFEKLIIIKYTPPITSIWLIYLWLNWEKTWNFIKYDFPLCLFSSFLVLFIWYNFSEYFKNTDNLTYFFLAVWFSIFTLVFLSKFIIKIILKKIYKKYDT